MTATKRSYGTGSLFKKHGAWYGRSHLPDGRHVSRRLGPVRTPGEDDGLAQRDAEAQLRKLMLAEQQRPAPKATAGRHTVNDAAEALRRQEGRPGRLAQLPGHHRVRPAPPLRPHPRPHAPAQGPPPRRRGDERAAPRRRSGAQDGRQHPEDFSFGGVFEQAIDLEWTHYNPVRRAARPRHVRETDPNLRFLTVEELEAVLRAIPDELVHREPKPFRAGRAGPSPPPPPDVLGPVLRVLVLTAAMTGLRQGELLALRWRDVDWPIQRVRVWQTQTWRRTEFSGRGKSDLSTGRSVLLADRVVAELAILLRDRHGLRRKRTACVETRSGQH